jgi:N-methylhydantoinase A
MRRSSSGFLIYMTYRLGVDVGGTFTDLLLIDAATGAVHSAKVPSTPDDASRGVLAGVQRVCARAGIEPRQISHVMHGTTVATNTVLTGTGARVGLVTTLGFRQVLQIARSFVPGGLGGWVIYRKSEPMAPLELTIEADERIGAGGEVVRALDEIVLLRDLATLLDAGVEALTVSLINAFANDRHERRVAELARDLMPAVPVSLSCEVIPEMQEYERTVTTVANSYVRPRVAAYVANLARDLADQVPGVQLQVLRSDGGLAAADAACRLPVNLLMSGPAGGVAGALWVAANAGYRNLLTLDMGGTSTDVALVQDGQARLRRDTTVGDVTVRASSIDIRTVGAGGGSIAHVPELTRALRVGPASAGADPGPACYGRGGQLPTVTDANVVLGYLPEGVRLGGELALNRAAAEAAVARIASELGLDVAAAAEGIHHIVNEHMYGALRLVSVEQGYDPRDFALVAFGGAGPLHANALGRLMGAWPVIVPPGPGVLCAYGDATTRLRNEASRTQIKRFATLDAASLRADLHALAASAGAALLEAGVPQTAQEVAYQLDLRYHGQGLTLTVELTEADLALLPVLAEARFDALHAQLFTFTLPVEKELVNLRAVVQGAATRVAPVRLPHGDASPTSAAIGTQAVRMDGAALIATVYDRARLLAGNRIEGPAIVLEMDATTVVLATHVAEVDVHGNLLIRPR